MKDKKRNLGDVKRLVVKVGSALLTRQIEGEGRFLDSIVFELLSRQIDELMKRGIQVVLVTSGAVAAGTMRIGKSAPPKSIVEKQAYAAIGQPHLMEHYEWVFRSRGRNIAQILLTYSDLEDRKRYLNARRTFDLLMEIGAVPIVNENDTVAVDEIKVGDNDTLSAHVAALIDADLLIILTVVDGLIEKDEVIPVVNKIDKHILSIAKGPEGALGTGGMFTKVLAAQTAGMMNIPTIVASGKEPSILQRLLDGEPLGTLFSTSGEKLSKRKHWIVCAHKPRGALIVDDGAKNAILKRGRSLLPKGILDVKGKFQRGDSVSISSVDGVEFARGLAAYSSDELNKLKGVHSGQIEETLGYLLDEEAVHRDDLTLTDPVC